MDTLTTYRRVARGGLTVYRLGPNPTTLIFESFQGYAYKAYMNRHKIKIRVFRRYSKVQILSITIYYLLYLAQTVLVESGLSVSLVVHV